MKNDTNFTWVTGYEVGNYTNWMSENPVYSTLRDTCGSIGYYNFNYFPKNVLT